MKNIKSITLFVISFLLLGIKSFAQQEAAAPSTIGLSDTAVLWILVTFVFILFLVTFAMAKAIISLAKSKHLWEKVTKKVAPVLVFGLLFSGLSAQAQTENAAVEEVFVLSDFLLYTLLTTIFIFFSTILFLINILRKLLKELRGETAEKEETVFVAINKTLTDAVPIEEEESILLDHNYDGIKELNNNLPPWWKWMFYLTIIFSFVYIFRYHFSGSGKLQAAEYEEEMLIAAADKKAFMEKSANSVDESSVKVVTEFTKGKEIFIEMCAACHGKNMEGGVGPNLTDEYWIHGGSIQDVFKSIKYGFPEKGMIAWQSQLSPAQMQEIASYIASMKGSNPANAKAPQGNLWVEEGAAVTSNDSLNVTSTDSTKVAVIEP